MSDSAGAGDDGPRIRVDVARSDGHVTRLTGEAAVAVVSEFHRDQPAPEVVEDAAVVCLRADTRLQLAHLLASVMATVRDQAPGVLESALLLSRAMDGKNPELRSVLPRDFEP